ncbi:hypothetical protein L596_017128 [Steinernema carpocapsae]|uniref:Uncharacterized protein n=1 Tax=Steinernema carpocapsae TaxID=34508 RepID=A0A4U5N1H6_STECR|nr:hypothetical protein L596_017128 [Steinernema carpocapsae]
MNQYTHKPPHACPSIHIKQIYSVRCPRINSPDFRTSPFPLFPIAITHVIILCDSTAPRRLFAASTSALLSGSPPWSRNPQFLNDGGGGHICLRGFLGNLIEIEAVVIMHT